MIQNLVASTLAFVSTNIDDVFILMLFYGARNVVPSRIVAGQYLGIGVLVTISLLCSLIGKVIDIKYIGLLGLFPIYLAVKQVYHLIRNDAAASDDEDHIDENKTGVLAIAGVTIANGADNLGVYIPLLATFNYFQKVGFVLIFLLLVLVWCLLARFLASRPIVAKTLSTYGHIIMPVVLLMLGVLILFESGSFSLFP